MKIEWQGTHTKTIEVLRDRMIPQHYRDIYNSAVCWIEGEYSESTDPCEKYRQYYAERDHPPVLFVPDVGGFLALSDWFPNKKQPSLLGPEPVIISGNCVTSYEAGYEQAKREPHMKDWFSDQETTMRHNRRRRGMLVQSHVSLYFRENYAEYWRPASNHGDYKRPAADDFQLVLPRHRLLVDVKSASYEEHGQRHAAIRNLKDNVIYLLADWRDDEAAQLYGIGSGGWMKFIGVDHGNRLMHVSYNKALPAACLLVMLNMARAGLSYTGFYRKIRSN